MPVEGSLDIATVQASGGEEHTAFLTKRGLIYMVGNNGSGQIGVQVKNKLGVISEESDQKVDSTEQKSPRLMSEE